MLAAAIAALCLPLTARTALDAVQPARQGLADDAALPLTVVSATPAALLGAGDAPIELGASQPIQVVFSRAVVALGSDAASPAPEQTPFTVLGGSAGRFRWLNSYVASFEPEGEWATDLTLDFAWNAQLASFDGAPLQEAAALQVRHRLRRGRSPDRYP